MARKQQGLTEGEKTDGIKRHERHKTEGETARVSDYEEEKVIVQIQRDLWTER